MLSRMSHLIQVMVRYLGCEVDGVSDTGALRGGGGLHGADAHPTCLRVSAAPMSKAEYRRHL